MTGVQGSSEARAADARGQCRTTETDWGRIAPYIRFRYERALALLPAEGTVYELGCGIGHGVAFLARQRPDLTFVGFDVGEGAITFGRAHFGHLENLRLEAIGDVTDLQARLPAGAFLIALEVIEHLDDASLEAFKRSVLERVDRVVFSFPYDERNIEGTEHLQSFDIYAIYEMFPGFQTVFIRRHSLKFIGYWERAERGFVREHLGVAREGEAIARIANVSARRWAEPASAEPASAEPASAEPVTGFPRALRRLKKLRERPRAFFRDSSVPGFRALAELFSGVD